MAALRVVVLHIVMDEGEVLDELYGGGGGKSPLPIVAQAAVGEQAEDRAQALSAVTALLRGAKRLKLLIDPSQVVTQVRGDPLASRTVGQDGRHLAINGRNVFAYQIRKRHASLLCWPRG